MQRDDLPLLARWLAEPHVERWWREPADLASVEARYGPAIDGEDPTELFIAGADGTEFGMLQRYRLADEPEYLAALLPAGATPASSSIDYLIGDQSLTGRGLGPALIELVAADTWRRQPAITQIVVAVQQDNRPSWRALEKAGFRRAWSGLVDSGDPADEGPSHVYVLERPR
jgi:aminoglycoside 6'-N-acetyltransferase